jgi:hypothetical protein
MLSSDLTQPPANLLLLDGARTRFKTLGGSVLAHHTTRPTLRDPEALDETGHCPPTTLRG